MDDMDSPPPQKRRKYIAKAWLVYCPWTDGYMLNTAVTNANDARSSVMARRHASDAGDSASTVYMMDLEGKPGTH